MSVILMTSLFYEALIVQGEIWCWSLLGLKGLKALGFYIFVRGFRNAYKRRGLYPKGLTNRTEKKNASKQPKAVKIQLRFAFTGF